MYRSIVIIFTFCLGPRVLFPQSSPNTLHLEWEYHVAPTVFSSIDVPTGVTVDAQGNLYITGKSEGQETGHDFLTVKINETGIIQWQARYDGPYHSFDIPNSIQVDGSGNVYVTGMSVGSDSTLVDMVTLKYSSTGELQWSDRYSGPSAPGWNWGLRGDSGNDLALDEEGNLFVTGVLSQDEQQDIVTIKYTPQGVREWIRVFDGPHHGIDKSVAIEPDPMGNIVVAGVTTSSALYNGDASADGLILKYDQAGDLVWSQTFSLSDTLSETPVAMAMHSDGALYIAGNVSGAYRNEILYEDRCDIFLARYSQAGELDWTAVFNTSPYEEGWSEVFDVLKGISLDNAGNVYLTGTSGRSNSFPHRGDSLVTIKYSAGGVRQWVAYHDNGSGEHSMSAGITADESGGVIVGGTIGHIEEEFEGDSIVVLRYDAFGQPVWVEHQNAGDEKSVLASGVARSGSALHVVGSIGAAEGSDFTILRYSLAGVHSHTVSLTGPGSSMGFVGDVEVVKSGDLYIAGISVAPGSNEDYAISRIASDGHTIWSATYDGPDNGDDRALALAVDKWGNTYVTGRSTSAMYSQSSATIKYDASGVQQWVARFDSSVMRAIVVDLSGNVYTGGQGIAKFDSSGLLQWYVDPDETVAGLAADHGGNIYAAVGGSLRKYNSNGDQLWDVAISSYGVAVDSAGAVYTTSHYWVTSKFTSDGVQQWSANVGGEKIILPDSKTVYVGAGYYAGVHKLSTDGRMVWSRPVQSDLKEDFCIDVEGNAYVVGTTMDGTGLHAAKYSAEGETEWLLQADKGYRAVAIRVDSAENVYLVSEKEGVDFSRTPLIWKYSSVVVVSTANQSEQVPNQFRLEQNYPNPFNPATTIGYELASDNLVELKVFDILGREVGRIVREVQNAGRHQVTFEADELATGVYFYQLKAGTFVGVKRLVIMK